MELEGECGHSVDIGLRNLHLTCDDILHGTRFERTTCCASSNSSSLWSRVWKRLRLDHVTDSISGGAGLLLVQMALVSVFTTLLDTATQNPDRVSSLWSELQV